MTLLWRASGLLLLTWALALPVAAQTQSLGLLSEDLPDVVFSQAIREQAAQLDHDPVRIYEFVRNELRYQAYYGLLKGPDQTLFTRAGNDYDLAALLVSLLRVSGVPARFVRGQIEVSGQQAADWVGMDNGIAASNYWIESGPLAMVFASEVSLETEAVRRLHVWVEARVPLANYRGRRGGSDGGASWVALDPSYKLSDWLADPELPIDVPGDPQSLRFDDIGPDGYYRSGQSRLPAEVFQDQVRRHLEANAPAGQPAKTIEEVALRPRIRKEEPGVLPTALPYRVLDDPQNPFASKRDARLLHLHDQTHFGRQFKEAFVLPGIGDFSDEVLKGASDYRHLWSIDLCQASVLSGDPLACSGLDPANPNRLFSFSAWSADVGSKRLTLSFPADDPSQVPPEGYAECMPALSATPTLWVDGVPEPVSNAKTVNVCQSLLLVIDAQHPLDSSDLRRIVRPKIVQAGGTYVPTIESFVGSRDLTVRAAQALIAARDAFPLADDGTATFVDQDEDGEKDGNELYLGQHFAAQEALVGGLLNLGRFRYLELVGEGRKTIQELHHRRPLFLCGAGTVEAGLEVDHVFDRPFAIRPSQLLIDLLILGESAVRDTGLSTAFDHAYRLFGTNGAAAEHAVWEEIVAVPAISMVSGFQKNVELDNRELLRMQSPSEAQAITGARCNGSTCTGLDEFSYCLIKDAFAVAGNASSWDAPGFCAALGAEIPFGDFQTEELTVLDRSGFSFLGFSGFVYQIVGVQGDSRITSYLIQPFDGQPAGGGAVDLSFCPLDPFQLRSLESQCVVFPEYSQFDSYFADAGIPVGSFQLQLDPIWLQDHTQDPVTVFTGNFFTTEVDLVIAGQGGMDLQLQRSYSAQSDYLGPLGYGWIHTFDQHLFFDAGDPQDPDDDVVQWVDAQGSETSFMETPSGFEASPWVHETLTREADDSFTITLKSGVKLHFLPQQGDRAHLDFIENRNGLRIQCVYDGSGRLERVLDSAGRALLFRYGADGFLDEVEDFSGRQVRYVVDENQDLVAVFDPLQVERADDPDQIGLPMRYSYYSGLANEKLNHNLKCWIKPEGGREPGPVAPLCGEEAQGHVWMHFSYYDTDRVFRHTSSAGEATSFDFNYFRQRTTVTLPDGSHEQHFFDLFGNIVKRVSPRGVVREYEYDELARDLVAERDGFGHETQVEYDDRGNMIRRVDRLGNEETATYNEFSQVTSHTDRRGNRREFEYDDSGNLVAERATVDGALRLLRRHEYDAFGNLIETIEHTGESGPGSGPFHTRVSYDALGVSVVRTADAEGNETRFQHDALGRPLLARSERTVPGSPSKRPVVVRSEYDALDRVVAATDPAGTVSETIFDANGNTIEARTIVPRGNRDPWIRVEGRSEYDAFDRVVLTTDALGNATTINYDDRGRPIQTTTPLGHTSRTEYDLDGNPVASIDPIGARTRATFDVESRPIQVVDPIGREVRTEYDREGRVVRTWQEFDQETGELRPFSPGDSTQRLLSEVLEYDPLGNPVRVVDAEGHVFKRRYDELSRTIGTLGPLGPPEDPTAFPDELTETHFEYDLRGLLVSRAEAVGAPEERTVQVRYDGLGRLVAVTDALGRTSSRVYDELGNVIESTNGAGQRVVFEYDDRGLLLRRRAPDAGTPTAVDDRYAFDAFGRLVLAQNAETARRIQYDALDRPISVHDERFGTARRVYDADGRTTSVIYPADPENGIPQGVVTAYQYDARDRIVGIRDPQAGRWDFEYDASGRLVRRRDPAGLERTITYDPLQGGGFVERIEVRNATGILEFFDYSDYDALGNPGQVDTVEGTTLVQYDALSRVTSVEYPTAETETFAYDRRSNRRLHVDRAGQTRQYEIDAADQLATILDGNDQVLESFDHDGAGRRTVHRIAGQLHASYRYDALGRLRFASTAGNTTDLRYDAEGARYRRIEPGLSHAYYFGEWVEERGGERIRLIHAGGVDQVLAEVAGSEPRLLVADVGGNVTRVQSATGSQPDYVRRYEGFGSVRISQDPLPVERGFAGRPIEGRTGLLFLRARHYDPRTGRFLQQDPLGIDADQLYSYAGGNPFVFGDPLGLLPQSLHASQARSSINQPGFFLSDHDLSVDRGRRIPEVFASEPDFFARAGQRFSNLVEYGQFSTDAEVEAYIEQASMAYQMGGEAGLADFVRANPPFGGTKAVLTMITAGAAGRRPGSSAGIASETQGAITNLGHRTVAGNAEIFSRLSPGQGMSGVFDHATGQFVLRHSTTMSPLPAGSVARYGGHRDVLRDLGLALGEDLSLAAPGRVSGFSLSKLADGSIRFGWNSGQINPGSHGVRGVPEALRPAIEAAVRRALAVD